MNKVYVGLGSNIGSREEYLSRAIAAIASSPNCKIVKVSSVYETKAYGETEQPNFFNAALEVETKFSLIHFLLFIKNIEKELGRTKRAKWGPREIDIDIILFNNDVYSDEQISVPHKDMLNRDFVLVPLAELNSSLTYPVTGEKLINHTAAEKNIITKLDIQLLL